MRVLPTNLLEDHARLVGPATRLFLFDSPQSGEVSYRFDGRPERRLRLSPVLGNRRFAALDIPGLAAILDPRQASLLALAYHHREGPLTFLTGDHYGLMVNLRGVLQRHPDPMDEMVRFQLPVSIERHRPGIRFSFAINPYNRECFISRVMTAIYDVDAFNTIELLYNPRTGALDDAKIVQLNRGTREVEFAAPLDEFPLVWPEKVSSDGKPARKRAASSAASPAGFSMPRRDRSSSGDGRTRGARPGGVETASAGVRDAGSPAPMTTHHSPRHLVQAIQAEKDSATKWMMILDNIQLNRRERTYHLLVNFGDLVSEQTRHWKKERIRRHFAGQSGPALQALMSHYPVNKVLALVEDSPERERVLEWLRDRETERLLSMDLDAELRTREAAARILNVEETADHRAVRQVWRNQLRWLNVDFGRSQERAIHRRKDTIAKMLQQARDLLMAG